MTDTKVRIEARKAFFAAVGAPMVVGKAFTGKITERFNEANGKATDMRGKLIKDVRAEFEKWAAEGESLVKKIQERDPLEDLSQRVDVDQFQEQVGKLRGQLEDIIESWRSNFTPDSQKPTKVAIEVEAKPVPAAKTATAKKPAAKKPAAKTAAKKATAKKPAAKTATAKKPVAKPATKRATKPAAKKPATRTATAAKTTKTTTARKTA